MSTLKQYMYSDIGQKYRWGIICQNIQLNVKEVTTEDIATEHGDSVVKLWILVVGMYLIIKKRVHMHYQTLFIILVN
jgi:hypothetical protein